jgi:hypothetical protein
VLKNFILKSADHGFPMTLKQIHYYANLILGATYQPIGESWPGRFIERHCDTLQTHWSKPFDMQQSCGMTLEARKTVV